jgi:hypothetical protein
MSDWRKQMLSRLPPALTADPKKSAMLGGLAMIAACVVLKQFVLTGQPRSAGAAVVGALKPAAESASSPTSLSVAPRFDSPVVAWLAEPIKTLDRNLFEFKGEFYPRSTESMAGAARVIEDEMFWDQLAKSLSARADSKKQRQIRVENLQQAAGKLKVQSTIMGPNPRAMVDGRMTRLGGTVEADTGSGSSVTFKVVRVEARRLVVERDGLKFEVPMGTGRARVLSDEE